MNPSSSRAFLLKQLAAKAGYQVGHVTPLDRGQVAAELIHDGDYDTANLVGAWYGLLSKTPRTLTFHEIPGEKDILHTWVTRARRQNVEQAARDFGIPHIHVSPTGRVYSFDQGRKNTAKIMQLVRNTRGVEHEAFEGTGQVMGSGSGPQSSARQSYRNVIDGYSRQ